MIDEHSWKILIHEYILEQDPFTYSYFILSDEIRNTCLEKAIKETVKEGDNVLDLGCGIGLLSVFAARAGANVYAIEANKKALTEAKAVVAGNNVDDRINFISGLSTDIDTDLVKPVDVIVSETLGLGGIGENIVKYVSDARRRWLKPNGTLIPSRIELYLALGYHQYLHGPAKDYLLRNMCQGIVEQYWKLPIWGKVKKEWLASDPVNFHNIDLYSVDSLDIDQVVEFEAAKNSKVNFIAAWFNAVLSPSVTLRTSPYDPISHWHHLAYPIEERNIGRGDKLRFRVSQYEHKGCVQLRIQESKSWQLKLSILKT